VCDLCGGVIRRDDDLHGTGYKVRVSRVRWYWREEKVNKLHVCSECMRKIIWETTLPERIK
jgi:hypothetical protein